MKPVKELLLTFDYELFLGSKSGTPENCLIRPTEELLKVAKEHSLSYVFFVDTLYLKRMQDLQNSNETVKQDLKKILGQLKKVIKEGHHVFHHLHPHWLDAVYNKKNNEWDVSDDKRFALSNLSEKELSYVFESSSQIIHEIYQGQTKPKRWGYRAGGLYAQPIDHYKKEMLAHDITLDFSVLKGASSVSKNGNYGFNYFSAPKELIYRFEEDHVVTNESGKFIEFSMDQFEMKGLQKILNGLFYRVNVGKKSWQRYGDGESSGNKIKSKQRDGDKLYVKETYSIELLNAFKKRLYVNAFNTSDLIHVISHPKLISPQNISSFSRMVESTKGKYEVESDVFVILKKYC